MANHLSCDSGVSYRSAAQNECEIRTEGILGKEPRLSPRRVVSSAGCHGAGVRWSECRWSRVNPTPHTIVNTTCQAKYMVRSVSWWTWTALASAWWSRPLLCPEVWLPSALGTGTGTETAWSARPGHAPRPPGPRPAPGRDHAPRPPGPHAVSCKQLGWSIWASVGSRKTAATACLGSDPRWGLWPGEAATHLSCSLSTRWYLARKATR